MSKRAALAISGIASVAVFLIFLWVAYAEAYSGLIPLVGLSAIENPIF